MYIIQMCVCATNTPAIRATTSRAMRAIHESVCSMCNMFLRDTLVYNTVNNNRRWVKKTQSLEHSSSKCLHSWLWLCTLVCWSKLLAICNETKLDFSIAKSNGSTEWMTSRVWYSFHLVYGLYIVRFFLNDFTKIVIVPTNNNVD